MDLPNKFSSDQFCTLATLTERQICSECGRKRMFFCYDCKVYVGRVGSMAPRVELPLFVDIVKHRHELNSKSTAIHALLISPGQTRIFDKFEEVPNYALECFATENVAVLFPSKNSQSIAQFVRENGPLRRIVVLDSTWNTVGQLRNMANIAKLPMVHLRQYTTDYWRPQNGLSADHLATIEAIYYACVESQEAEREWRRTEERRRMREVEEKEKGEDGGSEEKAEEEQHRLDNLLFWCMRPDPTQLRRYQLSTAAANGVPAGVFVGGANRTRRQWRFLLLLSVLFSVTFTFGFWTFQSDGSIFSPPYHKLEQFVLVEENVSTSAWNTTAQSSTTEGPKELNGNDEGISEKMAKTNRSYENFPVNGTLSNQIQLLSVTYAENATEIAPNVSLFFAVPPRHSVADLPACADHPPGLIGPIPVWMDGPGFETLNKLYPRVRQGGHNWPDACVARHRVAIIIPYRDREAHLRIFLHNLHFLLSKQQMDYTIFVVEQATNQTFNRAKLMNVGFVEASRLYDWQCFVFHDVDLLPEDDRNLYSCPEHPRHMSVAVDKFDYTLPYAQIFGGATAMTRKQFERVNGYSNDYWGWGGEDDDISYRLAYAGFKISRYPAKIARYKMVKHEHDGMNPSNDCRWELLDKTKKRWRQDGLSNLNYTLLSTTFHRMYTNFVVDLLEDDSRKTLANERISRKLLKGC
ncbi:hypothetical protein niasHS_010083 [Heterodera schachtii]|uniref:tRNA-uridine aminocarboxypropyltransferase n=1 Tax=Heterodera schachtii TaxID=97005 RepID=A0ABD2IYP4_HETSC